MPVLIVTDKKENWKLSGMHVRIVTHDEYIGSAEFQQSKKYKIINLCKSFQYQSMGYYVSLLAEARGHKVMPAVRDMVGFKYPSLLRDDFMEIEDLIQKAFAAEESDNCEVTICLGIADYEPMQKAAAMLFNLYQVPILKVRFIKRDKWILQSIKPGNRFELTTEQQKLLAEALSTYLSGKNIFNKQLERKRFDLAILINEDDPTPPSNAGALQKFAKAAEKSGFSVEFITKNDFSKLVQYDALFIRCTTQVDNFTYRFARKAQLEGLAVIDDPDSILKCTNKVYLYELLRRNQIRTPDTRILEKRKRITTPDEFPVILKQPDGAFSKGVIKVDNAAEYQSAVKQLFSHSDLIVEQEFLPTAFDWRVGICNGKPIYVSKYYMARGHWQIVNWAKKKPDEGKAETIAVEKAPARLINLAIKATALIGTGLYGVDIKEYENKYYIIEINDNPSIDAGIEDKLAKNKLYQDIMETFLDKLNRPKKTPVIKQKPEKQLNH